MDVNEYMKKSLELQERTATALEALVKAGFQQVNVAHHSCGKTTGGSQVKHPETEVKDTPAETKVEKKEETKVEKKEEAKIEKKEETAADKPAETKAKKVTADDARKALKAYAAIEGNDAAMELLTSLGAGSVSALAEQGDDKLAELVAKCGG
jgi:archaellum component FlaD/FlaE